MFFSSFFLLDFAAKWSSYDWGVLFGKYKRVIPRHGTICVKIVQKIFMAIFFSYSLLLYYR
jgi:hypothetical protein